MTNLYGLALMQDKHEVTHLGGMEAVGHCDQRARTTLDCGHNRAFTSLVEGTGGLIHQQDAGMAK
jgi:hypothetical protein